MAKISLCLIVGNVQEHIARCLESFLPAADEVCMVRAVGGQKWDHTLTIARDVCEKAGKPFICTDYYNQVGHADWPHIDDFAAARQMSFDLASGDYCLWCDSDDILKQGAERIRKHADEGHYACFMFPYEITGRDMVLKRERMMLKDSGRWKWPVHENYKFRIEPVLVVEDESVIVQHLPEADRALGSERNLRILESIPKDELNAVLSFHLFGELLQAGRVEEAMAIAARLLNGDELGKDERYDLLLSLTLQMQDLPQRVSLMHEAYKTDPERREALAVLATTMMGMGENAKALAYARQMIATVGPEVHPWNSRRHFYGPMADDIYQKALRAAGH